MADRLGWMPGPPEMHVFQAEISGGEQIVIRSKPQRRAIIANSGHHPATFWQGRAAVTVPRFDSRARGNFDLRNESFF